MTGIASPTVVLPGAGGGSAELAAFGAAPAEASSFQTIDYPGWRRYIANDFTPDVLLSELTTRIASEVPHGSIRIVGNSIGGHFGYAAALRLQAMGREVSGFCAIDTFMISSSGPSEGWKGRALTQALELLREGRLGQFFRFARSKFWRALLRLAGNRLPSLLTRLGSTERLPFIWALDPVFEEELSMRLLIRKTAPYIASLDHQPAPLRVPSVLIRTLLTAGDDPAWRRRCPNIKIFEIPGAHHSLFEPKNIGSLRDAFLAATSEWR